MVAGAGKTSHGRGPGQMSAIHPVLAGPIPAFRIKIFYVLLRFLVIFPEKERLV